MMNDSAEDPIQAAATGFDKLTIGEHNELVRAGIARTTLRTGDVPRGINLAVSLRESSSRDVSRSFTSLSRVFTYCHVL
eukprot:COSAG05_NODE_2897_length_2529_cov_1.666667_4_plen_79_part_00